MNYPNGQKVLIGDEVALAGSIGVVVAAIEDAAYSHPYQAEQWAYLKHGVLIEFRDLGLIHYAEAKVDLILLKRASSI